MTEDLLEPRLVRMPNLASGTWLNTTHPFEKQQLLGHTVMIDFWDYTCVNCLRTLPYLKAWHRRYADQGLIIIGIHSPEFRVSTVVHAVSAAIDEHEIPYPILLDNQYENWERFANKAWPTKYLADSDGYLRYHRQGEGYYRETEAAIQILVQQNNPQTVMPGLLDPVRAEDSPGAVCYRATPELYAGYQMGGLMGHALGNPEGYATQGPVLYEVPEPEVWLEGRFYLHGMWRAWPEALAYAGRGGGRISLPYSAVTANVVLSPSADPLELDLGIQPAGTESVVEVRQDGRFLTQENAGRDVAIQPDGRSILVVSRTKMYELVRNATFERHVLELEFSDAGLALFSFTFTSCTIAGDSPKSVATYTIH